VLRDLKRLPVPLVLVVGGRDRTVRPADARRIRALVPGARIIDLAGLGHLAHEERPAEVAGILERIAAEVGILAVVPA
jgi:magnesium chelatase accessory protein